MVREGQASLLERVDQQCHQALPYTVGQLLHRLKHTIGIIILLIIRHDLLSLLSLQKQHIKVVVPPLARGV